MPMSPAATEYLDTLKSEGRSSPAGKHWHQFHEFLDSRRSAGGPAPPRPFMLAASGEPNAGKHRRLAAQLSWAQDNGCLEEALRFLRALPPDSWNSGTAERWDVHSYIMD